MRAPAFLDGRAVVYRCFDTEAPRWNIRGRRPVVRAEYLDLIKAIEGSPNSYTAHSQRRVERLRLIAGVTA